MSAGKHNLWNVVLLQVWYVHLYRHVLLGKGAESTADISHDNFNVIKCGDVSSYIYFDEYENEGETILEF